LKTRKWRAIAVLLCAVGLGWYAWQSGTFASSKRLIISSEDALAAFPTTMAGATTIPDVSWIQRISNQTSDVELTWSPLSVSSSAFGGAPTERPIEIPYYFAATPAVARAIAGCPESLKVINAFPPQIDGIYRKFLKDRELNLGSNGPFTLFEATDRRDDLRENMCRISKDVSSVVEPATIRFAAPMLSINWEGESPPFSIPGAEEPAGMVKIGTAEVPLEYVSTAKHNLSDNTQSAGDGNVLYSTNWSSTADGSGGHNQIGPFYAEYSSPSADHSQQRTLFYSGIALGLAGSLVVMALQLIPLKEKRDTKEDDGHLYISIVNAELKTGAVRGIGQGPRRPERTQRHPTRRRYRRVAGRAER
jgi:hypothetical protein